MSATIVPFTTENLSNSRRNRVPMASVPATPAKPATLTELLTRHDVQRPRYNSYPTAEQYTESVGVAAFEDALKGRCLGGLRRPMSLYVHVPFCESACYFCTCNKVITRKHERVGHYLNCLEHEAMLIAKKAAGNLTPVIQFHMGGGTPTFLNDKELLGLVQGLKMIFPFAANAEMSIEVDPRTVDESRLLSLRSIGFNQISFGVQDFNPVVQKAVHREQSSESIESLVKAARRLGFESINIDLIYGLPKQNPERFAETLDRVVSLSPDRIAIYGYSHFPERFKSQRRMDAKTLPDAAGRVALLSQAIERMQTAGYDYIGTDHFAKPQDALAVAKRQGRLHRNFQGYSTQPDSDLIGLGVSAISKVGSVMVQNTREIEKYEDALSHGHLALFRGHECTRDDLIRHSVIMGLLCQGSVRFADFSEAYSIDFESYFKNELVQLGDFVQQGLLQLNTEGIEITTLGWFCVRSMVVVFDRYFHPHPLGQSKVL